ncbi:hypothetical protein [Nitratireductor rhodophyticola]|uniref:hypothetical protein n=1 Tax=Nitratireductor rhodophyticola TaxID=2854036 RepID=UPI001CA75FCA|nr:hypothetical protein [Nitratireductor rhodophyticola]
MQESEEVYGLPVESGGDTSEVFQLIETSFDGVANLVGLKAVGDRLLGGFFFSCIDDIMPARNRGMSRGNPKAFARVNRGMVAVVR